MMNLRLSRNRGATKAKPVVLMQARRWFVFVPLMVVLADRVFGSLMPARYIPYRLAVVAATLLGATLAALIHAARWQRRLRGMNYSVCPDCGYELTGLPDDHACPECGRCYQLAEVQAIWRYYSRWR